MQVDVPEKRLTGLLRGLFGEAFRAFDNEENAQEKRLESAGKMFGLIDNRLTQLEEKVFGEEKKDD